MEELPKAYNPKEVEDRIYKQWEKSGFFTPENLPERHKKPFVIILPPPNVTAALHMGSALMLIIQDIIIRYERMRGRKTLWLPGTDHASIATEEKFLKESKISKSDYADKREEFINLVNDFALKNQSIILKQMKAMGASLDWSRLKYTLDPERIEAVEEAFIRMHKAGLIYMGSSGKVINWDPKGQTVVSDDEIEYEPVKTILYTFRYSKSFPIAISSTRPETKVGDTAVAVHPSDERYKKYIGKTYDIEFAGVKLSIKVVGDPSVEPLFGTGALGVTPAHSIVDSEIASRHNLPSRQVIDESARMTDEAGQLLKGKKTTDARNSVVEWLKNSNLLEKEEIIEQNIPKAQRSGGIIEPLPKRHQFFVNVNRPIQERGNKTIKELLREAVTTGKIKILPERFEKIYLNWIDNLRDWSISRQIWYGIRPPVWYIPPAPIKEKLDYVVSRTSPGKEWARFNDTLDTWFSSGLWTFSALGWPKETKDLKTFHPTDVLETAYDILFFWVARMILMSQVLIGDIPFRTVYLHGLVRDEKGRKISKSLGNNIDPIDMIEQYGTDAVRMAMVIGTSAGNDSKVSLEKFKAYKHFANKIWNISRFVLMNISPDIDLNSKPKLTEKENNYLMELDSIVKEITNDFDEFKFYLAGEKIYHYIWHTFADKIIEEEKEAIKNGSASAQWLMFSILITCLKLLHPFMPFVTEEIWSKLPLKNKKMLVVESWPQ